MDYAVGPGLAGLLGRLEASIERDPAWWRDHVRRHARSGKPLPHHPRMGVTRAEYAEMLRVLPQVRMRKIGEAILRVREQGGRLVLDGGRVLPHLTGVVIDPAADRVSTPSFGSAAGHREVEAAPTQLPAAWSGVGWSRDGLDPKTGTGTYLSIALGQLQQSGDGILYFDGRRADKGRLRAGATYVLTYRLPTSP